MSEALLPVRLQETDCRLIDGECAFHIVYVSKIKVKCALN